MYKRFLYSSIIFTIIDLLWIKYYMGGKYEIMVNEIQGSNMIVDKKIAGCAYLVLCFALNYFVIPYVTENDCRVWTHSFIFGLVLYATYDFTCGAVFHKWDKKLMIIDILWGGIVFVLTNYLTNKLV